MTFIKLCWQSSRLLDFTEFLYQKLGILTLLAQLHHKKT